MRETVKYLKTSDGDTMRAMVDGENVRIRFLGINTPEVAGENKVEEPWGNEALLYTQNRLDAAQKIEIEYDTVADQEDRFGRKLAWIWVDDELFEVELLEQGLAKTYMLKNDYKYASELKAAEKKAKQEKLGVWSDSIPASFAGTTSDDTQQELNPSYETEVTTQEVQTVPNGDMMEEPMLSMSSVVIAVIILAFLVFYTKWSNQKKKKGQKK